ncbi:MAG: porphobilinogen synthase [Peptococcaceae bacterium]|nr:porphobilinogen synthase [Peptococcaceae bacterium]
MTMFPETRMRRLRRTPNIRRMVQDIQLNMNDYIYPIFVVEGEDIKKPIVSMPGINQFSLDHLLEEVQRAVDAGVIAIMLFGIPAHKDDCGSEAYNDDGIIQKAVRLVRANYPDLVISTDVCMCEYTDHGHCGIIKGETVDNDSTVALLAKIAVSHAKAGADILAPSDMMDGRIGAIRDALDDAGYEDVIIMAHSVKYASGFYGPFRDAAESAPHFGDRKSYQMDPASGTRQALQEVELDLAEGADMVIIKPSLAYLDLIATTYDNTLVPIVAYNVSAEYSMVKAAAANGWIDEKTIVLEIMNAFKRAGAKMVITYHAIDLGNWLKEEQ